LRADRISRPAWSLPFDAPPAPFDREPDIDVQLGQHVLQLPAEPVLRGGSADNLKEAPDAVWPADKVHPVQAEIKRDVEAEQQRRVRDARAVREQQIPGAEIAVRAVQLGRESDQPLVNDQDVERVQAQVFAHVEVLEQMAVADADLAVWAKDIAVRDVLAWRVVCLAPAHHKSLLRRSRNRPPAQLSG